MGSQRLKTLLTNEKSFSNYSQKNKNTPTSSTWRMPWEVPGNIRFWSPSRVQKTVGWGLPVAAHESSATPFNPTVWELGRWMNIGSAKNIFFSLLLEYLNVRDYYISTAYHHNRTSSSFYFGFSILLIRVFKSIRSSSRM